MQNCGNISFQKAETPGSSQCAVEEDCAEQDLQLTEKLALVYGSDAQDRGFLADKLAGYRAPDMGEIFNNWRRISSDIVYPNGTAVVPEPAFAFCFTGLDADGNWNPGVHPDTGKKLAPGTDPACIDSVSFASSSWSYLQSPGRLHNATNAGSFNGFVSTLKFERYVHEAVLGSTSKDDDLIGLIAAFAVASDGAVHTLTAARTQGGFPPKKGWGLVHRRNNTVVKVIGEKSVGGTHCSNGCSVTTGDGLGWNGRLTKVQIERELDRIVALASPWGTAAATLTLDNASRIEVDLSDPSLGLEIFRGAQAYGYGIQSQQYAEYSAIQFNAFNSAEYVYDLVNDTVYRQNATGGYSLVPSLKAFLELGYPALVGNVETRKQFRLNPNYTFELMP